MSWSYQQLWDEEQHPRDDAGRFTDGVSTEEHTALHVVARHVDVTERPRAIGRLVTTGWRVGSVDGKEVYMGGTREDAEAYSGLHKDSEPSEYRVEAKNALVAKDHFQLYKDLNHGKSLQDAIHRYEDSHKGVTSIDAWRAVQGRMMAQARAQGYDAIVFTAPPPPAKQEIVVISKTAKIQANHRHDLHLVLMEAAPRRDAEEIAERFEVGDEERRRLAEAIYVLLLAQARNEAFSPAEQLRLGLTDEQMDDLAEQVARARSAEMVGMRWTPDGDLQRDPGITSDVVTTAENAVNAVEDPTPLAIAALVVFSAEQTDLILGVELSDAVSAMQLGAWEAAGASGVVVRDAWDPNLEHCDECIAIDGSRWSFAMARANLKEHPHCCRVFEPVWS